MDATFAESNKKANTKVEVMAILAIVSVTVVVIGDGNGRGGGGGDSGGATDSMGAERWREADGPPENYQ